jgi:acetyl-CoA acetyltransferase
MEGRLMVNVVNAADLYRTVEGLGVWPHRGQVAAVGIGHSPTMRRWDGDPQHTVGAWAILAIRRAIEDAGVDPAQIDGLVVCDDTSTGSFWPADQPLPADFLRAFENTDNLHDGLDRLSPEWIARNMPELTGIKMVITAPVCMSMTLAAAIESVGRGLATTCLAVKGWHNFEGRHYQGGANAEPTVSGPGKYGMAWAGPASYTTAMQFQRYLHKYGKTHDMMAPFIVNSRHNGLMFPEGYFYQHRNNEITADDYNHSRWIAEPANLFDNDMPINVAGAYVITTADRARDLRQKPVYVLGHAGAGEVRGGAYSGVRARGTVETLEEAETNAAATGRKLYEAAGVSARDIQFENSYDGFSLFHVFHIEGFGFAGIKQGEALDLFQTDISIHGPNPVSPSGGNIGSGRSRFWMHTDSMQQIQGRAGARQMTIPAHIGLSGGFMPFWSNFIVCSSTPNP